MGDAASGRETVVTRNTLLPRGWVSTKHSHLVMGQFLHHTRVLTGKK